MDVNSIETLLESILQELSLLTVQTKATAIQRFNTEYLTTDVRKKAYEKFDGEKTLKEISDELGCNLRTLQVFSATLIENNLIDFQKQGNNKILSKNTSKIAIYYAAQDLKKEEINNG
ncbi:MAG: hypothetical protein IKV81_00315 [Clostridia bacterium]|nr:hypothetical protein [Clostridia bacterium]